MPYIAPFGFNEFNDPSILSDREAATLFEGAFLRGLNQADPDPLLDDLLVILAFFDRLNACMKTKLCDEDIILASVCISANNFKITQARMIEQYVAYFSDSGIDNGIDSVITQCKGN